MSKAWQPSAEIIQHSNIQAWLDRFGFQHYQQLHQWSWQEYQAFWPRIIEQLQISFKTPYQQLVSLNSDQSEVQWFEGAKLNIVESCFNADPTQIAIHYLTDPGELTTITFAQLHTQVKSIAHSLHQSGYTQRDTIAMLMPMTPSAVAIFLGIIQAGCTVVAIADSFSPKEIASRLEIAHCHTMFVQDYYYRCGKTIHLSEKVQGFKGLKRFLVHREQKLEDHDFYQEGDHIDYVSPEHCSTLLFSSGTTGTPKAIPWTHSTPIKCASDAYFHQDVHPGDVLAWPSNLGWMMGPWLVYAALINQAALALYEGAPTDVAFGRLVQDAGVTMLGLVPSIVKAWRHDSVMEQYDWSGIKCFSSSGECSNASDMAYLMDLAGHKPIIEYCGGTEIGGAYITSTVVQTNFPATFSTPAMGLSFTVNEGEVAILSPSIGLSTGLWNRDHFDEYFKDMPVNENGRRYRRHGDEIDVLDNGYYRLLGRTDDTMNLSGIKVSSAEIERCVMQLEDIDECAAVAVAPKTGGPSMLIMFVTSHVNDTLKQKMNQHIKQELNPLIKIHSVRHIDHLPRTASNKIMRRVLREALRAEQ